MLTRSRMKPVVRAAVGGLLGILLVVAGAATTFAEDEQDEDTFEMRAIKSIMRGLGAQVDRGGIDYRERSPLVIPPSNDLPPPQAAGTVDNPAWPNDPDKRKVVKKSVVPFVNGSIATQRMESPERNQVTPDGLRQGMIPGTQRVTSPDPNANKDPGRNLAPGELGFTGGLFSNLFGYKAEQQPFTGEPARTNLAQPPTGYQTPSPNYPYGVGIKNETTKDLKMVKDRAVGGD